MMQPSQINHLKEAALDIRASLIGIQDIIADLLNQSKGAIGSNDIQYEKLDKKCKNAERALTRIEMCLKEIK
jgi:hypothetical protein